MYVVVLPLSCTLRSAVLLFLCVADFFSTVGLFWDYYCYYCYYIDWSFFLQFCLFLFYHFNFLAEFFSHTLFFSMIRTASSLNPEKLSYIGGDWFGLFLPLHFDLLHGHWLSLEQHSALFVWHFNWLCFQYRGTVVLSRVRGELLSCGLWVSFMLPNCILSVYAYSRGFVLRPALVICASVAMADTLVFIFLLFFWAVCLLLV